MVAEYTQNVRLKAEHEARTQAAHRHQQAVNAELARFDEAAAVFAKHRNIPQETFDALSAKFFEECNNDPFLGREFADIAQRQGPMATIRWAYEKMTEINKNRTDEAFQKRNLAKDTVTGITQSGKAEGFKTPKTYDELVKLGPAQRNQLFKNNRKLWKKLCTEAA